MIFQFALWDTFEIAQERPNKQDVTGMSGTPQPGKGRLAK
jgi:hypothetical protein